MRQGEHRGRGAGGDRGLYDFARIIDDYGTSIVVRTSSAAYKPCVWLFVNTSNAEHVSRSEFPSPHLGVREAKLLRDALDRFIQESTA